MNIYSIKKLPNGFYVYAYLRNDGRPYYIGKGINFRAWKHSKNERIKTPKNIDKIVILESNLTDIGALALERRYIKWHGRKDIKTGILYNKTEGGEGVSGRKSYHRPQTNVTRKKNSASKKGTQAKEKNPFWGKTHSTEMTAWLKKNSSEKQKGIPKRKVCCLKCCKELGHNGLTSHFKCCKISQ